jgi:hypothetical protein
VASDRSDFEPHFATPAENPHTSFATTLVVHIAPDNVEHKRKPEVRIF